jgi:FkbM family methyltransferase
MIKEKLRLLKRKMTGGCKNSYAQHGEDLLLNMLFNQKKRGFYVDVGAYHPRYLSNTYYFYKRGWRGINIDATAGSMKAFKRWRPRDVNIEAAISDKEEELSFYHFKHPSLNTFFQEQAEEQKRLQPFLGEKRIKTLTLSSLLDRHLPPEAEIDFLSIDAEGFDLKVLLSNDWARFVPKVIVIEKNGFELAHAKEEEICLFLEKKKYRLSHVMMHNLFFIHDSALEPV